MGGVYTRAGTEKNLRWFCKWDNTLFRFLAYEVRSPGIRKNVGSGALWPMSTAVAPHVEWAICNHTEESVTEINTAVIAVITAVMGSLTR